MNHINDDDRRTYRDRAVPRLARVAQAVQTDGDLRVTPVVVVVAAAVVFIITIASGQPEPLTPQVSC